jgi:hypothetical protein
LTKSTPTAEVISLSNVVTSFSKSLDFAMVCKASVPVTAEILRIPFATAVSSEIGFHFW